MNTERIAKLSPEKRRLLERLLSERAGVKDTGDASRDTLLRPRPPDAPLVLSAAQQRMWVLAHSEPESPAYNVTFGIRFRGGLRPDAMRAAVEHIVARHAVLRTAFLAEQGEPRIHVYPSLAVPWTEVRLDFLPLAQAEAEATRQAEHAGRQRVDITQPPLLRTLLFRLAPEDHVLWFASHHIAFDGWSIGILLRELDTNYAALVAGRTPSLPPLPMQYADYAHWERTALVGETLARLETYWHTQLAGAPPELVFPNTQRERRLATRDTGSLTVEIAPALYQALQQFCRDHGFTPFMVLLAGLKALLQRFCGTDDVIVGTQSTGRGRREWEELIGVFVNPLALRTDLSGAPGMLELCRRVRETVAGAFAHQELPFERVVRIRQARVEGVGHPVFNVVFQLRHQSMTSERIDDLLTREPLPDGGRKPFPPKFDLVFSLVDTGQQLGGAIEYNPEMFTAAAIALMHESYAYLLAQALAHPQVPVTSLSLLSAQRRRGIVEDWNRTATPYTEYRGLHHLFERTADRSPDACAVAYAEHTLSYRELDRRANQLARYLLSRCAIGPDRVAAVYLERSPDLIIACLAILKAGGAFLLIDPRHASQRMEAIFTSAQPVVTLTLSRFRAELPSTAMPICCLDDEALAIARASDARPGGSLSPDNLAYLIYTSGSTGTPKGVMAHHRGLSNLAAAQAQVFPVGPTDRVLQFAALTFDAFVWELVMAWRSGATLQLASWEELLPGPELLELLRRERVTCLTIPPSVLAALPTADLLDLPDLQTLIVAGEACPAELVAHWAPGRRMVNAYGPTETTIWATYEPCVVGNVPPIGRPIANFQVYVLDAHLEPVPPGVVGELYIGGVGLARGYLGRADLTAERFLPDPFAPTPGCRLYRTDDLGCYLPDGRIRYEGRADDQVKIRGFRVEPGEVQAVIARHPSVRQAYVMAVAGPTNELQLAAWYTTQPGPHTLGVEELRAWVDQRLPSYLRPAAYLCLEELPLTPNGKVDRKRLPAPDHHSYSQTTERAVELHGAVEETLARVWSEVLGVERISRDDNFFALGGDSILGIRVIARANAAGIGLRAAQLFEHSTIAALASVARLAPKIPRPETPALEVPTPEVPTPEVPAEGLRTYGLSPMQEGLLYDCLKTPTSSLYVQQFNMFLHGSLDRTALVRAWQTVLDRHDALRTAFIWEQVEAPLQQVHTKLTLPFHQEDWRELEADAQMRRWRHWQQQDVQRGFTLDHPPLLRCALFQLAEARHAFTWTVHHLLLDGWSLSLITREVFALYHAYRTESTVELPTPAPFADYIDWLTTSDADAARAYWRRTLAGFSDPVLLSHAHPVEESIEAELTAIVQETVLLPAAAVTALQALCRRRHVTLNTAFQAAWALVLSRYTGRDDLVYGLTVSGRPGELHGVESIVGLFVNTLPLRLQVPHATTVSAWLAEVQQHLQELRQYEFSSLVEAQSWSGIPAGDPLFDTLVAFQTYPTVDSATLGSHQLRLEDEPQVERTGYPLTLLAEPGESFQLRFMYDRRRLAPATIAGLATHLCTALATLPAAVERPVAEWSMLTLDERNDMLRQWGGQDIAYPQDRLVHQWIATQAARRPQATAVIFEGTAVSYADLNARANRLAHWLRSRGVGPDEVVALHADRSIELIVALLAVLKAGGAYLPLATEHPQARVQVILTQARPRLILTQRHLRERLPETEVPIALLDEDMPQWRDCAAHDPLVSVHADNLAYVIYTSGSTGEPKGVMNSHGGILNRLQWCQEHYPLQVDDRLLQKTPYTFDVSVWEFFWPLMTGACLVVARPDGHRDSAYLVDVCTSERVTVLHFVPSMLQVFLEDTDLARRADTLRLVICSGEALTPSLCERFHATLRANLLNLYGPTEAAVEVSHWLCQRDDSSALVPIGRPIANVRLYVLDAAGQLCPPGVSGELHIGGVALARGYQARADLTAGRFVPDPLSPLPGQRLYRTGDLTRYRADGEIEYLGRLDWQVKIRGQRVELSEIEEHLRAAPGVLNAVVTYSEETPGDGVLIAYPAGDALEESSLRAFLADRLPSYMMPAFFFPLATLPLTLSGKVDRKALPVPKLRGTSRSDSTFAPPRDTLERAVARQWAELLAVDSVGVRDHFFLDLGGHSLLALRLVSRMRKSWPGDYALSEFLREPTVEHMARLLRGKGYASRHGEEEPPLVPLQPRGDNPPFFLTPPALGVVLCYYELAFALGSTQPVQAFQSPMVEGRGAPINDIPTLARGYLTAMRQVQPHGPYFLGGYSFGGMVAFEMARQLEMTGEQVAALIIFDTLAPPAILNPGTAPSLIDEAKLLAEIAGILERYHGVMPSLTAEDLQGLSEAARFTEVRRRLAERDILHGVADVLRLEGVFAANRAAMIGLSCYQPSVYHGRIDLIRCLEPSPHDIVGVPAEVLADPTLGWERWSTQLVTVWRTPGDHVSLLKSPGVVDVARVVTAILGRGEGIPRWQ